MSLNYLIKPSLETKFYIDYDWWEHSRDDLQIYLLTHLTQDQQKALEDRDLREVFDYVHPETGEILRIGYARFGDPGVVQERRFHKPPHRTDRQCISRPARQQE